MPAIQVYKGQGKMIPVDVAKQAKAYICPWTEELFATKRGYVTHLKQLRKTRMHARAKQNRRQRILDDFWNQPTFSDIIKWVDLHPEFFFDNVMQNGRSGWTQRREKLRDEYTIKITHLNLQWSESVSNSHRCPHNGITNWGGRTTLADGSPAPRGYPGWRGRIELSISHDLGFTSDVFNGMRIHTGTGGGGHEKCGYDVSFFDADWPGLTKQKESWYLAHEKEQTIRALSGKSRIDFTESFTYGKTYWK